MRRFLRGRSFRVIVLITAIVLALSITFAVIKTQSPQSSVIGTILSPLQNLAKSIDKGVDDFFNTFTEYDELKSENEKLKQEIMQLEQEKIEWQEDIKENEFYKEFFDIKEENKDYQFSPAKVISRDTSDIYGNMSIDVGSIDGIKKYDPVITSEGLVGYVSSVSPTYSIVTTVLSSDIKVGVNDPRTGDTGIVTGSAGKALNSMTQMINISRSSSVAEGDYIVTSGGGVFPKGLRVGTVKSVGQEKNEQTLFAEIDPAVDIFGCSNVMVITSFAGQNN